nr:hypothetical protein [Tanacetum cinerariifolium]
MTQLTSMCEMFCQFVQKKREEKRIEEEQAAKPQNWKIPACCDDDNDYKSAITPTEPVDSLSMGEEHLNTIPATESDEFIKSCVENLVPNPNVLEKIFSNPLFEEEIIPMKIDPHYHNTEPDLIESMLNRDSSIIPFSSKIDSLLDEFAGKLTLLKSIPPGIDETDCYPENDILLIERLLYDNSSPRLPEELVSDNSDGDIESFSPSPIPVKDSDSRMEEIDLSSNPDDPMLPGIKEDDDDSERDILIHEELLDNYSLSLPEDKSYQFDIPSPSCPPAKPPDGNTGILNIKMMGEYSDQKVRNRESVIKGGKLEIESRVFDINLIPFGHGSFDSIRRETRRERETLMSAKASDKKQGEIVVVRDFPKLFSDDLSGLSHVREIKFRIELIPGAVPVAKSPYCLEPLIYVKSYINFLSKLT